MAPESTPVPDEDRRWRTWAQTASMLDGPDLGDLADELREWRHGDDEGPRDPFAAAQP